MSLTQGTARVKDNIAFNVCSNLPKLVSCKKRNICWHLASRLIPAVRKYPSRKSPSFCTVFDLIYYGLTHEDFFLMVFSAGFDCSQLLNQELKFMILHPFFLVGKKKRQYSTPCAYLKHFAIIQNPKLILQSSNRSPEPSVKTTAWPIKIFQQPAPFAMMLYPSVQEGCQYISGKLRVGSSTHSNNCPPPRGADPGLRQAPTISTTY